MTERLLTLYSRARCPLCEEMAASVAPLAAAAGVRVRAVDVDADPALKSRFGWDVPLLFAGEREICRHRLDLPAVRAWLAGNP